MHDVCSAIHPLGVGSPFFRDLPLARVRPGVDSAARRAGPPARRRHGGAARALGGRRPPPALGRDGGGLSAADGAARRATGTRIADASWGRCACRATRSRWPASACRRCCPPGCWPSALFRGDAARALFAGMAAHSILPLEQPASAAVRAGAGHAGARRRLADAARRLAGASPMRWPPICARWAARSRTGAPRATRWTTCRPPAPCCCDVTPRQLLRIAGPPPAAAATAASCAATATGRACSSWIGRSTARSPGARRSARRAGTVHLGGTLRGDRRRRSARVAQGGHPERPFVLLAQQSLFDPTRAPAGRHTAWAYCHVPNGSTVDMTAAHRGADRALRPRLPRRASWPATS